MGPKPPKNTWICTSEKKILTSPVMEIIEQDCRSSEDDRFHRFYLLRSKDWCNIIPITHDGKVVFVKQFRIGISQHTLEVPGGIIDPNDRDLEAAAIREI
jgi:ADP-ribose pyrophosphatase